MDRLKKVFLMLNLMLCTSANNMLHLGWRTLTVTTKLLRAATLTSLCRPIFRAAIGTCKVRPSTEIFTHPTRTHAYTEYSQFLTSRCLNFSISETAAIWDPFRPFFMRTGEREGVCLQVSRGCSFPCWKENLESLSMSLSSHLLSFMTLGRVQMHHKQHTK